MAGFSGSVAQNEGDEDRGGTGGCVGRVVEDGVDEVVVMALSIE